MKEILNELICLFFPKRCIVCDDIIHPTEFLCKKCTDTIIPIKVKTCLRCGNPKKLCSCKRYIYHFRAIASPFINEDNAKQAIYQYKFGRNIDGADYFANHMVKCFVEKFPDITIDCVVSVPRNKRKKNIHSFDHAGLLAKRVAKEMSLPYKRLLIKQRNNKVQHELSALERFENVRHAYKALSNNYKNILLVDDIKTTGATLDECARMLMLAGTENVYCLTAVISA